MAISGSQASFAAGVLRGIGAPITPQNIRGFVGWAQAEGGWGHNNPLNTTQGAPGAGTFNSVGVKTYPNAQVGINATVQTLKNGHYGGILQAFHANNPRALAGAIGSSPWGTSGSLAAQTIAAALGQPVPPVNAGPGVNVPKIRAAARGQRTNTATSGLTRFNSSVGGGLNTEALAEAVLAKEAAKPIDTSGKPSKSNPLADYLSAESSGLYNVPAQGASATAPTTTFGSKTIPGHGSLRGGGLQQLTGKSGNINPLGREWTIGRTDQGVDANAPVGAPIRAINDSVVVGKQDNWYAGQPIVLLKLTAGPDAGKFWYVAEQISSVPHIGQHFAAGQTVARYAPSGTGIEIGWGSPNSGGLTLAGAQGNTGDASHGNAPAGIDFSRRIIRGLPRR